MALSATISLSASTVTIQQPLLVTLTVSNSGGSPVILLSAQLISKVTGNSYSKDIPSFAGGVFPLSQGFPMSVPAGGSISLQTSLVYFQPSPGSSTFDVSATCFAQDGETFSPTAATLTVLPYYQPDAT